MTRSVRGETWSPELSLYALQEHQGDPFSFYERLHRLSPLYWDRTVGAWVCTRYAEARAILLAPRAFGAARLLDPAQLAELGMEEMGDVYALLSAQMLFLDGETHRRIRNPLHIRFDKAAVASLGPLVSALAQGLLARAREELGGAEEIDLVRGFADPLPTLVVAHLLGLPRDDLDHLLRWNYGYEFFLGLPGSEPLQAAESMREALAYFTAVAAARRRSPGDDLISLLVGAGLADGEVAANAITLLGGGFETATHLTCMTLYHLGRHHEQLQLLRTRPDLLQAALNETMRLDGSSQMVARQARADTQLGEAELRAGQNIVILLPAANRDERAFPSPGTYDLQRRPEPPHLGFSYGPHMCLGWQLGLLEAGVAVQHFLELFEDYQFPADLRDLPWGRHYSVRCVERLPVRVRAAKGKGDTQ